METKITITPELAIRVGALAEHYQDASVEIAHDGGDQRLWKVAFETADETHRYIVNDETGEATADTSVAASCTCGLAATSLAVSSTATPERRNGPWKPKTNA